MSTRSLTRFALSLGLFAATVPSLSAQTAVAPYRPGLTAEGITYHLPLTALHLTVHTRCRHYVPGEYAAYARALLDRKDVSLNAFDTWTLTGVKVDAFGTPDSTAAYTIRLDHRTAAPLVTLSPNGLLLAVNAEAPQPAALSQPMVTPIAGETLNADRYKTPDMLRAGSTARRAELAAAEIFDIRENRNQLIKGQADFNPKDGEQLKTMLAQLDEREKALTSLFVGTYTEEERTFTFDYVPRRTEQGRVLFRFSKYLGVTDPDDAAGMPVTLTVEDLQSIRPAYDDGKPKKKKEQEDLRYRVPGEAKVRIAQGEEILYEANFPMAQFGRTEHLGGTLFNKKFNTKVWLSPTTGNVEKIELDQTTK